MAGFPGNEGQRLSNTTLIKRGFINLYTGLLSSKLWLILRYMLKTRLVCGPVKVGKFLCGVSHLMAPTHCM